MEYLGNYSATPPEHSRHMECYDCDVSWTGCWDNFQCPKCGKGELPEFKSLARLEEEVGKPMTFEEKLHKIIPELLDNTGYYSGFLEHEKSVKIGALWGREETVKEICEWLDGEEGRKQFKINSHGCAVHILKQKFLPEEK